MLQEMLPELLPQICGMLQERRTVSQEEPAVECTEMNIRRAFDVKGLTNPCPISVPLLYISVAFAFLGLYGPLSIIFLLFLNVYPRPKIVKGKVDPSINDETPDFKSCMDVTYKIPSLKEWEGFCSTSQSLETIGPPWS